MNGQTGRKSLQMDGTNPDFYAREENVFVRTVKISRNV